ncbi:hypothetical protein GGR52DRAFT_569122 [Hypoxylon sp. FL1284]|nr:hypothetical protein GGR52DRAFT_569122 [Hypoxylon sp. FL1284]
MSNAPVTATLKDAPFPLTEVDKWILSLTDEEYKHHDWEDMKKIISKSIPLFIFSLSSSLEYITQFNNLSVLKRKPSDLRRYMEWTAETKAQYGSITAFLLQQRLPKTWGSPPFTPVSATPFDDPSDYRVLVNDWPYGLTPDLTHIVVWSRTTIETDPQTGGTTPGSRSTIEDFVKKFFVDRLGSGGDDKVLWFKNWVALQSVRALEHIHIIVRDVEKGIVDEWTKELDCHRLLN